MNIFSNLVFNNSSPVLSMLSSFPANPLSGQMVLKGGVVYIYITISGTSTWYPLTNSINYFVHVQGIDSIEWIVNHGLNSTDLIFFSYDNLGSLMRGNLIPVDDNSFKLDFTVARSGKVVVFAAGSDFTNNTTTGILNTTQIVNSNNSQSVFTFDTNGDIIFNGIFRPTTGSKVEIMSYKDIISGFTCTQNDYLNLDSTGGSFGITLPSTHVENDIIMMSTGPGASINNITVNGGDSNIRFNRLENSTFVLDANSIELKFKSNGTLWEVL